MIDIRPCTPQDAAAVSAPLGGRGYEVSLEAAAERVPRLPVLMVIAFRPEGEGGARSHSDPSQPSPSRRCATGPSLSRGAGEGLLIRISGNFWTRVCFSSQATVR